MAPSRTTSPARSLSADVMQQAIDSVTSPVQEEATTAIFLQGIRIGAGGEVKLCELVDANYWLTVDRAKGWQEFEDEAEKWPDFPFKGTVWDAASKHYTVPIYSLFGLQSAIKEAKSRKDDTVYLVAEPPSQQYRKPTMNGKGVNANGKRSRPDDDSNDSDNRVDEGSARRADRINHKVTRRDSCRDAAADDSTKHPNPIEAASETSSESVASNQAERKQKKPLEFAIELAPNERLGKGRMKLRLSLYPSDSEEE